MPAGGQALLPWEEVERRVLELIGQVYDSPFANFGRFGAWVGISQELVRQWSSRGVAHTMLTRLLAEAATIPLSDWTAIGGERERLHDDNTGALDPVWAVGLVQDVGLNPRRVQRWQNNEMVDAEERLALLVCLTREGTWKNRYMPLLAHTNEHERKRIPEDHRKLLEGIRRERLERGYTQEDMGELMGCTRATVASWEAGYRGYNWRSGKPTAAVLAYAALVRHLEPNGRAKAPAPVPGKVEIRRRGDA